MRISDGSSDVCSSDLLSSGLHSPVFLQKMRVFQDPARTERLCRALAEAIRQTFGKVDLVVSPAVGGILPGYETARALGCHAVFVERAEGEIGRASCRARVWQYV